MPGSYKKTLVLGTLFLFALIILGIGAAEHTGITGKDEYYLGFRTPLCMQEQQVWLVPCLDGEPRLRKPPMLYWLTRASFEVFGASLASARFIALSFAALLVLAIAMLSLELGDSLNNALTAGLIALSCVGLAVGGRMLELDVPVATWSAFAWIGLLRWYRRNQFWPAILGALAIAAGFLTKGPVVVVVCGAGALAMLITEPQALNFLIQRKLQVLGILVLTVTLALPWFLYVYTYYPEASIATLENELAARRFLHLSLIPISGFILLALPWGFIALDRILALNKAPVAIRTTLLMRILWLGFTLLPFFFIRTFERYLIGSIVPLALLLTIATEIPGSSWRWAARLGLIITLPLVLIVQIAALIITGPALWLGVAIPINGWFIHQWWQANHSRHMAVAAAMLWACTLGLAYPRLGVNQVPTALLDQVRHREVVLYDGPQPALVPILLGRSLVHIDGRWLLPQHLRLPEAEFMLLCDESEAASVVANLQRLQFSFIKYGEFGILSSRVTWANMWRPGITNIELLQSLLQGDIEAIKPKVLLYLVHK